ncbi:MAG: thiamine biosynthesis protein ThiS [Bacteroidetes bacterium]|jgi:sulfur carrier protein|nr:thiamine biosynthesis protein ThiS [Bacteroidota bacterium]
MIVLLNGQPHEVDEGISLAFFIQSLGLQPQGIAVAIDYEVIPKEDWMETILSDQIELMLIHAASGG